MVFEDFVVPDPVVAGILLAAVFTVATVLYVLHPTVSQGVVLGFVPWMVFGGLLHALYQMHVALGGTLLPERVAVLFSAPSVYLTTFVFMGLTWTAAVLGTTGPGTRSVARVLAGTSIVAGILVGSFAGLTAFREFALEPVLPLAGLLASLALTLVVYLALGLWQPDIVAKVKSVGAVVLFAHVFDALTTAIGIELLDAGERSTAPQLILDIAADLPTADLLGVAWLFVVVKVALAAAIVVLFHDYVDERPTEGYLFFALIAAVGLGPGAHNFFLFVFAV